MEKINRSLKLPDSQQGGLLVEVYVNDIISMETPTESTLVDPETGIVYEIDVNKHTLINVKSFKKSGNYEYYIPLTLKEMIQLVNSDAAYTY